MKFSWIAIASKTAIALAFFCGSSSVRTTADSPQRSQQPKNQATASSSVRNVTATPLNYFRRRTFAIPFSIGNSANSQIEVHLYVSNDAGHRWYLVDRQAATAGNFVFRAPHDGEYWFSSRIVDLKSTPDKSLPERPELRVIIDTVEPRLRLNVMEGASGEITTTWQLADQYLRTETFKIEYRVEDSQTWRNVSIEQSTRPSQNGTVQGKNTWWPQDGSHWVLVRAEVRDAAGNLATTSQRIRLSNPRKQGLANSTSSDLSEPVVPNKSRTTIPQAAIPWQEEADPSHNASVFELPEPSVNHDELVQNSRRAEYPFAKPEVAEFETLPAPQPTPELNSQPTPELNSQPTPELNSQPNSQPSSEDRTAEYSAESQNSNELTRKQKSNTSSISPRDATPYVSVTTTSNSPREQSQRIHESVDVAPQIAELNLPIGERPHITNRKKFHLEYDVESAGSPGIAKVELWGTADHGQTWTTWSTDTDRLSPVEVKIEEEGIYGFRVVITTTNGLAGARPQNGEPADLWIGVDTTEPVANLREIKYGDGDEFGQLVIHWSAQDLHLAARPVTLIYSESANGPWHPIASGLPNTGRYSWETDASLPESVFLRIEVRDEAGNEGADQSSHPIRIPDRVPKGRIRGFRLVD